MRHAIVLALALAGCAHATTEETTVVPVQEDAYARVGKWVGRDIHDVVRAWGKPTIDLPNGKLRTFEWRWGAPERFDRSPETSMGHWVDQTASRTAAGALISAAVGWKAECKELFDVDSRGRVVAARANGVCPPDPSMILEGTQPGTEGLGVGEL